jgi:NAD(P)-dependent dehydrogenase (short-subunit alcohol dehydrogenase family)
LSKFNKASTAEEVTAGLDLSGQVALVTGCTSGTGLESARALALRGAHVLATGRTIAKVEAATAGMYGNITPLQLELTDLNSINHCASTIVEAGLVPDIVICNAGMDRMGDLELVNGIELKFFANFLGHFVLVNNLLPFLLKKPAGRLVHVSSDSAHKPPPKGPPPEGIDFDNLRGEGTYDYGLAYGRSKLANALFSFALSRKLDGTGWTSNAIHPGSVYTNIAHAFPKEIREQVKAYAHNLKTPAQGAATQVYVATHPELDGITGKFFADCDLAVIPYGHHMEDESLADKLWSVGEEMGSGHMTI